MRLAVTALGALAGLLMILTELLTVASVDVANGSCEVINDSDPALADRCVLSGAERHGYALVLVGLLVLVMAWGAGIGWSRPAATALIAFGAIVLGIGLVVDLPVTDDTGAIGTSFEGASARAGAGMWVEPAAGALAIAAGVWRLTAKEP